MSWLTTVLAGATSLVESLSQNQTNGLSQFGTLSSPTLPRFLENNPLPHGTPWGMHVLGGSIPNTGVIRTYDFTITRSMLAPDGFNKSVIVINDQFPGPLIEANWGDTLQIKVHNNIEEPEEGVTLHWHGQTQRFTPWYDGVPAITQCPIAPRSSFVYNFRAENFGSSWYHSHFSGQYGDGLLGPLIIYGPEPNDFDIDLGPIIVSDYTYESFHTTLIGGYSRPLVLPTVDNNLINGKGIRDCTGLSSNECTPNAGLAKFRFEPVIANDYVPIEPYTTDVITLGIGQRADVVVEATGQSGDAVWMRSDLVPECLPLNITYTQALAAIYYGNASETAIPNTTATTWEINNCAGDPIESSIPLYPSSLPEVTGIVETVNFTLGINSTGYPEFQINGTSFRGNYNNPLLLLTALGNTSYPYDPQWNVWNFGQNSSIRLILKNYYTEPHPMHLHGHDWWILAEGYGDWDGRIIRPENPLRRDTHTLLPGSPEYPSYMIMEWKTDNPGVWPLHCHNFLHQASGMLLNIYERPDDVRDHSDIPSVMAETCRKWWRWTDTNPVDQIDSGLK